MSKLFTYSFAVWPDETMGIDRSVFDLFRLFGRVETQFTQDDFIRFSSSLARFGLTLREIEVQPLPVTKAILHQRIAEVEAALQTLGEWVDVYVGDHRRALETLEGLNDA